jgi:hypothetical protein
LSICNTVGVTQFIFVGTVASIEPAFLSRWGQSSQEALPRLNEAYAEARDHPSADTLSKAKDAFLKLAPALSESERRRLESAKTALEVASLFNAQVYQGIRVRLKVRTLFKHQDNDDDDRKPDAKKTDSGKSSKAKDKPARKNSVGDIVEVWTTFGDCSVDFQAGETYLVYADEDEGTDQLFSDKCSRTRRLSDAGEDLAYLFFYKDHHEESSRIEGYATSDPSIVFDYGELPEKINRPVPGLVIELRSSRLTRYAETDNNGRYVFDGLAAGDYQISAFPGGYQLSTQAVSGPHPVQVKESSCAQHLLFIHSKN